jgi:hypothetical protein
MASVRNTLASLERVLFESWRSKTVGCLFILSFAALFVYWLFRHPLPGYGVGFMGAAVAIMSLRLDVKGFEKAGWLIVIFGFLIVEILAIRKDRMDTDTAQAQVRQQEANNFSGYWRWD